LGDVHFRRRIVRQGDQVWFSESVATHDRIGDLVSHAVEFDLHARPFSVCPWSGVARPGFGGDLRRVTQAIAFDA